MIEYVFDDQHLPEDWTKVVFYKNAKIWLSG